MTLEQMAIELGLKDASALRHAFKRGTLKAERVGNRTLIVSLDEMERYAREHRGRRGRPPTGPAGSRSGIRDTQEP